MSRTAFHHAIVCGGSIAGLLAARALSERFARVTVIERDGAAAASSPRTRVPQGLHAHTLLMRGERELERFFPGIADELLATGSTSIQLGPTVAWHFAGGWRKTPECGAGRTLAQSRPHLENAVARRVRALPNVAMCNDTRALEILHDGAGQVTGLRVREGQGGPVRDLSADLVVDASGRGSTTPRFLEAAGFAAPVVETVAAPVTYTSAFYRRVPGAHPFKVLLVTGAPSRRIGFMFPVEGDRWLVSLSSMFDERAPRTFDEFLAFSASLCTPEFNRVLRDLEPVSELSQFRFAGSRRCHYDRLRRFPRGLVVTGDAVCSFNPLFGQGMTVSAIEARLLADLVAQAPAGGLAPDFAAQWFRAVKPVVDAAWTGVQAEDLRYPELAHLRTPSQAALQWYLGKVHKASHHDGYVTEQLLKVISFTEAPASLLKPRFVAAVMRGCAVARAGRSGDAPPVGWPGACPAELGLG